MSIRASIVGGAGYTGGELIRILLRHPQVSLGSILSRSHAGEALWKVHTDMLGDTDLKFSDSVDPGADVWFLCLGHGEAKKFLEANPPGTKTKVIDLSQDFRLDENGKRPKIEGKEVVYGLPEWNREAIRQAAHIANPGCFATTVQLGLLPLAAKGWLKEAHATGITGSTGAGQSLQSTSQFSWRANNISAYKTLTHQHVGEIRQTLKIPVHFVPWRGDFTRGIFVTSVVTMEKTPDDIRRCYREFYADHPFTHLSETTIDLKQVVQTNKCLVQLEQVGDQLAIHTALDNLLKGAGGQAVQNMNLVFGLDEKSGLDLKSGYF